MSNRRLSRLLLASHMGLVLLLAVLLLGTGVGTIRAAVEGQARTEAERAVDAARQRIEEWKREVNVAVGLLSGQPTLGFYLQRRQLTKANKLVGNFHATSDIDYIQVELNGRVIAEFGPAPPSLQPGFRFDERGAAWRVVSRPVANVPGATIVMAERIGERLDVRPSTPLVNARLDPNPGRWVARRHDFRNSLAKVGATGEPETFESIDDFSAIRVTALRDGPGPIPALVSASVADEWVERRFFEWLAAFFGASLATCALALGLAFVLSARISRPFAQVSASADRLGSGDLETPVSPPKTFLAEPVSLASSLESMRQQVGSLAAAERSQRQELDAVLDGVDEGIAGLDPEQRIHYANRQFLALAGRRREDVLGQPLDAVLRHVGDDDGDAAATLETVRRERYVPVGGSRPLVVRRLPASGNRQLLVVREENAVEAARGMRDRILANLSHEFQTPLSAQIASIELLRDHLRDGRDPIAVRLADSQFRGTMRLSQLVDNLLESVRIESGELRLRRQPVDLPAAVGEAIELMQPLLDQRDQRVEARLAPGPVLVGDPQRLSSVVVNLLANANKFAPDQSRIWVDLSWAEGGAELWVEDEGPGLPVAPGTDLFAPFRRSPDEEPSQRGTGLGLAIVHAIVRAHGGHVRVAPPQHGRGARIGVILPVEAPAGVA
jgi:signal transduction histidine kinase/HAMP domain-containing protein